MTWIFLVLLYGLLKGAREIAKKKAMQKNSVMEVLFIYTVLSFVFVIPQVKNAGGLEPRYFIFIAAKSFCMFLAWLCSFRALKKLPVSLFGIIDLSRVLFATFLGVAVLGETVKGLQLAGLVLVCAGLLLLKFKPGVFKKWFRVEGEGTAGGDLVSQEASQSAGGDLGLQETTRAAGGDLVTGAAQSANDNVASRPETQSTIANSSSQAESCPTIADSPSHPAPHSTIANSPSHARPHSASFYIALALVSCALNAVSGFLDKVLMKDITSSQLQFWYTLFVVIYYAVYILCTREKIRGSVWKNGWVWLLAIMFVIGDKALFIANGMEASKITVMTLIKQSGCLVTIIGGKFIFHEKNIGYKLFCAAIIILGIVLGVL